MTRDIEQDRKELAERSVRPCSTIYCGGWHNWTEDEVERLRAKVEKLQRALREILEKDGMCQLGPEDDREGERYFEKGSARAFSDCAAIAREALEGKP